VEPEVDIRCPDKARAEALLKAALLTELAALPGGQLVMLKLTLPEQDDLYAEFVRHPAVLRVGAVSGGHPRPKETAPCAGITVLSRVFRGRWWKACLPANRPPSTTPCWMTRSRAS